MVAVTWNRPIAIRTATLALALMCTGLVAVAVPARAAAATFYAAAGGTTTPGCPLSSPCALNGPGGALTQAQATPGRDTVQVVGPLSVSTLTTLDLASDAVDLVGSGSGAGGTLVDAGLVPALNLGSASSVRALRVRSNAATEAIRAAPGSALADLAVEETATGADGITITGAGTSAVTVAVLSILLPTTGAGAAINSTAVTTAPLTVLDTTVRAPIGLSTAGAVTLERVTLLATGAFGVDANGGGLVATSSVIRALGAGTVAIRVRGGAGAVLRNLTLDGLLASGASGGITVSGAGSIADVRAVVARNFAGALSVAGGGVLRVADSDVETAGIGAGVDTSGGGMLDVDPRWRDQLAGDYRLKAGSPLVDAAGTPPAVGGESPTDREGHLRAIDGDGDGNARRDIGAYERRPPVARLTFRSPASAGSSITFDGENSDYADGEIVGYRWDLDGNGSYETDTGAVPRVMTKYPAPDRIVVRLQVIGDDGATATASKTLIIVDSTPPRFINASMSPTRFAPARYSTALVATRQGTTISYQVTETATVQVRIQRIVTGRVLGGVCRASIKGRAGTACQLFANVGTLVRKRQPPVVPRTLVFSGRLRGKPLPPGTYVAALRAADPSGNISAERRLLFRVVAR
jgi:hypothetical protein